MQVILAPTFWARLYKGFTGSCQVRSADDWANLITVLLAQDLIILEVLLTHTQLTQ